MRSSVPWQTRVVKVNCLAGFKVLKKLGLSTKDLIPVELRMHAADNHDIQLLGAAILRLTGRNHDGKKRTTRQIVLVYVTNHIDKLFLSREACADLGIISHQFPLTGEAQEQQPSPPRFTQAAIGDTGMHLSPKGQAPSPAVNITIPRNRGQQGKTEATSTGLPPIQHLQYL